MRPKLLDRQLRAARSKDGDGIDVDILIGIIAQTYEEVDRERRLNDRAISASRALMSHATAPSQTWR